MPITNGYLTLPEIKSYLNIGDTADDTELEIAVEAASRAIDRYCNRHFYSAVETRYYTPDRPARLRVDDLVSVTTLKTDPDGDGTYQTTWTAADYVFEPYNAGTDGRPYTVLRAATGGAYSFPAGVPKSVEIDGTFGWPAVPTDVKQACAIQAAKIFQISKDGGGGFSDFGTAGGSAGSRYLERSTEMMVRPHRKLVVL